MPARIAENKTYAGALASAGLIYFPGGMQVMVSRQIWTISMHSKYEFYVCRVCGAEQLDPPWGEDGKNVTFDLCDCCGVEFGYEDATLTGIRRYREEWLSNGAKWKVGKAKPKDWLLEKQLKNVPKEYV